MENPYNEIMDVTTEEDTVLNPFQHLVKIFVSPTEVFKSISKKPVILLPLILLPLVVLAYYLLIFEPYKELLLVALEEQFTKMDANVTPEFITMQANVQSITTVILSPLVIDITMLGSALYYFLASKVTKGNMRYKLALSLVAHASLITVLYYLMLITGYLLTGDVLSAPMTSLASLLPSEMERGFIYGLLISVEVFTIWKYILIALGLSHVADISKKKSYIIVAIAYAFASLLSATSVWVSSMASNL